MRYIKLFEQFIVENNNDKRLKEIEKEIKAIDKDIDRIQTAISNGKINTDEAELQLSDLDGHKLDLEAEAAELQRDNRENELESLSKIVDKYIELIGSSQSSKWKYMVNHCQEQDVEQYKYLIDRDEKIEKNQMDKAKKLADKMKSMCKHYSQEAIAYVSFLTNEYTTSMNIYADAMETRNGALESCEDFKLGCENVKEKRNADKIASIELERISAELRKLKAAI